jgi:toxin secretion/phage lysis holin
MQRIIKGAFAGLGVVVTHLSGMFTPLFYILIIFESADYITGIAAAIKNGGLTSREALWGFVRKVSYFVLVGVAFLFDLCIVETTARIGMTLEWRETFGIFAICYLISTEGISIMENLHELGVSVPILQKALKIYHAQISNRNIKD